MQFIRLSKKLKLSLLNEPIYPPEVYKSKSFWLTVVFGVTVSALTSVVPLLAKLEVRCVSCNIRCIFRGAVCDVMVD